MDICPLWRGCLHSGNEITRWRHSTHTLLGTYAYIAGRKWALNKGPLPITKNEVLQLTIFTDASVHDAVRSQLCQAKGYVLHSNRPPPNKE